jgi:hypothetical protein
MLSGELPFGNRIELLHERVRLKTQISSALKSGILQERVDAMNAIKELVLENEHQPFLECAVFLTAIVSNTKLENEEKRAITELVFALSSLSEDQLDMQNLREGIITHRLCLTIAITKSLFREEFYKNGETDAFGDAVRSLIRINPERALYIIIDQIGLVQSECLRQISAYQNEDKLKDPDLRVTAVFLDAFSSLVENYGESCAPSFKKAVEDEVASFVKDVTFLKKESENARAMNSPLKHFMQLTFLGKLLKEARSIIPEISIDEIARINGILTKNQEIKSALQERQ